MKKIWHPYLSFTPQKNMMGFLGQGRNITRQRPSSVGTALAWAPGKTTQFAMGVLPAAMTSPKISPDYAENPNSRII